MIRYNYMCPSSELASPFLLFMLCFSLYLSPPHLQRDKTKGVEGLIEIANPNRVVKKTKKAGDIDINARVELSRRERLVASQSHSQSHVTASFQFQSHNAVSFPVTCHSLIPVPVTQCSFIPVPVTCHSLIPVPVTQCSLIPVPVTQCSLIPVPVTCHSLIPAPVTCHSLIPVPVTQCSLIPVPVTCHSLIPVDHMTAIGTCNESPEVKRPGV